MSEQFTPTDITHFDGDGKKISVEIENSQTRFAWRLVVDGQKSDVDSYYEGIHSFKGWHIATAYWHGTFPEFVPFQIKKAKRVV